jgi:hypothetical protein
MSSKDNEATNKATQNCFVKDGHTVNNKSNHMLTAKWLLAWTPKTQDLVM